MEKYVIKKVNAGGMPGKYLNEITWESVIWTGSYKKARLFNHETAMYIAEGLKKSGINCIAIYVS